MPMFKPSKRDVIIGCEGGVESQVLDLDTAVKDGVLGGVGNGGFCGGIGKNLDLRKMVEELNLPEVPSVFICPISLEPMQDPVTLCTGQTYERNNILKWFSLGHYTCPTTMQELWDDTVTPNTTLYHLIYTWFSQRHLQMKKKSEDVQERAAEYLTTLKKVKGQARVQVLKELKQVVATHANARNTVVNEGGVALVSSLLGPFTSHAVGSEVVAILVNLTLDLESKDKLIEPAKFSLIIDMLNEGSLDTRINCILLMITLIDAKDFQAEVISSHRLLVALMRLVRDVKNPSGIHPGLGLLRKICLYTEVRNLVVTVGAVPQLIELLPSLNSECLELALIILDTLSCSPEGSLALKDCSKTIPNLVRLLMKVSESAMQYALSILSAVCKLSPEECSSIAVDAGLAAKLLLVIQSGCNPVLKQRAAELLKLCSLNYSDTIFISKCKLTRTTQ